MNTAFNAIARPFAHAGGASWWKRARISAIYLWRHRRLPELDHPRRFTEWVQWRKLNDRDPSLARLTDKLHAKAVAGDLAVPTVWSGTILPKEPPALLPLIVKANHGCNQFIVIRSAADWAKARRRAPAWLRRGYGGILDEWHYGGARRLLLVEPFLGGEGAPLPLDYKVYVFGGRAEIVQLHEGRGGRHRWTQFDRDWRALSEKPSAAVIPERLDDMLAAAERLAGARDFLRVDFYLVGGTLWFGEFCLFPGSGLDPFRPAGLDDALGRRWAETVRPFAP